MTRCAAITAAGKGCTNRAAYPDGCCVQHSTLPEARAELARRLAGRKAKGTTWPTTFWAFRERYATYPIPTPWRVLAKVLEGVTLDSEELAVFVDLAGHDQPPVDGAEELVMIMGRGSAKTGFLADHAVYTCIVRGADHLAALPAGSLLTFPLVAGVQRQSGVAFKYAVGLIKRHRELAAELNGEPRFGHGEGLIRLRNGIEIQVGPWSKASSRGGRLVGLALDEIAWTPTSEASANQDTEVVAAYRGGMIAPTGAPPRRLLAASSAGGRRGWLYETHERFFGTPHPSVLVVRAGSRTMNPTISEAQLARAQARDPIRFSREYGHDFADTVSRWVEASAVDSAPHGRDASSLLPDAGKHYAGAIDAAFKKDAFAAAVGHMEVGPSGEPVFVVDVVERMTPPLGGVVDSVRAVAHLAEVFRRYRVSEVLGDQFAAIPLAAEFRRHGITLTERTATSRSKLELFTRLREMLYARRVSLPHHDVLLRELRDLQETITASGSVRIDHPVGGSSDCASAVAWCFGAFDLAAPPSTMEAWATALDELSDPFASPLGGVFPSTWSPSR